ncbi:hypothetical protein [Rufibacter immobilis]|uniref:hypothetical protein n=1 Tax=Rufibacter immobilis TaxID=1348778 RepID=UPI0035E4E18E
MRAIIHDYEKMLDAGGNKHILYSVSLVIGSKGYYLVIGNCKISVPKELFINELDLMVKYVRGDTKYKWNGYTFNFSSEDRLAMNKRLKEYVGLDRKTKIRNFLAYLEEESMNE